VGGGGTLDGLLGGIGGGGAGLVAGVGSVFVVVVVVVVLLPDITNEPVDIRFRAGNGGGRLEKLLLPLLEIDIVDMVSCLGGRAGASWLLTNIAD
jgi:hypothetical protein